MKLRSSNLRWTERKIRFTLRWSFRSSFTNYHRRSRLFRETYKKTYTFLKYVFIHSILFIKIHPLSYAIQVQSKWLKNISVKNTKSFLIVCQNNLLKEREICSHMHFRFTIRYNPCARVYLWSHTLQSVTRVATRLRQFTEWVTVFPPPRLRKRSHPLK